MGKSNALLDGQPLNAKTAWHGWSVLPFPSPGDLPNPGMEPRSPALQADVSPSEPQGKSHSFMRLLKFKGAGNTGSKMNTKG